MGLAIIGCGFVADFYLKTMQIHPELKLMGVMDRNKERAIHFSHYHSVSRYTSLEEIFKDDTHPAHVMARQGINAYFPNIRYAPVDYQLQIPSEVIMVRDFDKSSMTYYS